MPRIGPHPSPKTIVNADGRTKAARMLRKVTNDLTDHVGGKPTVPQAMLIERAAWLTLHIALMDREAAVTGVLSDRDRQAYLAWVGTLSRVLRTIGLDVSETLANHGKSHEQPSGHAGC